MNNIFIYETPSEKVAILLNTRIQKILCWIIGVVQEAKFNNTLALVVENLEHLLSTDFNFIRN